MPPKYRLPLSQ